MEKTYLLFALAFICLTSVSAQVPDSSPGNISFPKAEAFAQSKFSYKIIPAEGKGFGYDIFSDGKLLIHQPVRPGMPGKDGFASEESAKKVAELVIEKINKGEMPPTVTDEEMKKIKVLDNK